MIVQFAQRLRDIRTFVTAAMIALLFGATPGVAQSPPAQPARAPGNNLVIELRSQDPAVDLGRLEIEVRAADLKEPVRIEVRRSDRGVSSAAFIPPGKAREIQIRGYASDRKLAYEGSAVVDIAKDKAVSLVIPLTPLTNGAPVAVSLASYDIRIEQKPDKGGMTLQARVFDPNGTELRLTPDDYNWGSHAPAWYDPRPFGDKPGPSVHFPPPPANPTPVAVCDPNTSVTVCIRDVCRTVLVCGDPVVQVSAGGSHTCALTKSGLLFCWGDNSDGALGAPSSGGCGFTSSEQVCNPRPTRVVCPTASPCTFREVSAGLRHTCAIDTNRRVWCWGLNSKRQLGAGSSAAGNFVHVSGPADALHVAAGDDFTCAITGDVNVTNNTLRQVWCWGANDKGQAGVPLTAPCSTPDAALPITCGDVDLVPVPTRIMIFPPNKLIVAGSHHACAVTTDGWMQCWGDNNHMQVANMQTITVAAITGHPDVGQQTCGTCTVAPVLVAGALVSGANGSPLNVAGAGGDTSCASLTGSVTTCWGSNPVSFPFTVSVTSIDAGAQHACAVTSVVMRTGASVTTLCWGDGSWGQLGNGTAGTIPPVNSPTPVAVITTATYTQVSAGGSHTCALTDDGHVHCWGRNSEGQLGTGSFSILRSTTPVPSLL